MRRLAAASLMMCCALGCRDQPGAITLDAAASDGSGPPATAMADALAAAGLDVAKLPALTELGDAQMAAVMDTFTRALGVGCGDCHAADPATPTRQTRIAGAMWDRVVRGLERRDGGAIYCDSCHAGHATFLDRSDPTVGGALGRWMRTNYVAPLKRRDGVPHDCATCHGAPFVGGILDGWGGGDDSDSDGGVPVEGGAPPDLGRGTGCEALLVCLDACAAGDGKCSGACKRRASAAAKALLATAQKCANDACVAAKRCKSANDDSADCDACFSNASAGGATGVACVPVDDPACGACAAEWLACEND